MPAFLDPRRCFGRIHAARLLTITTLFVLGLVPSVEAQSPRVSGPGAVPADRRLEPLKDLDGYFPFEVPATLEAWEVRREEIRRRILVANGLWPRPELTPVSPVIHGKVERDGYSVERVYFESLPGFFVTGSLYRPVGKTGPFPGVLCPHGHWSDGRFYDAGEAEAKNQIGAGAEVFVENGRSPLQARCAHLARMGCVVFHYDMIGYADSQQISFDVAHRFAVQRPHMNGADGWGLFSPRAESLLQSVMGLQTLNSVRSLEFLMSLDDVDSARLAVTGASGGGTQTFMLAGIEDRLAASYPAVMVSTAMQGGCTCENCALLRVGTGNVEFAALFAPRPQGMLAADDWTKEMETKGFPELKRLYELYGAGDQVHLTARLEFGHNYNAVGRKSMYEVFGPALGFEVSEEERIVPLSREELTVWNEGHPKPEGGEEFEKELMSKWNEEFESRLEKLLPTAEGNEAFKNVVGPAIQTIVGRTFPEPGAVTWEATVKEDRGGWFEIAGWLRNSGQGEALPAVFLHPRQWNGKVVLWFDSRGKDALYGEEGLPLQAVVDLVNQGISVGAVDLFGQGEFQTPDNDFSQTRRVANPRESAGYTLGYNHSLFAQRVHDVMSTIAYVAHDDQHGVVDKDITVIGSGVAGPVVAVALSQVGGTVDRAFAETQGFRFAEVSSLQDPGFLPGGARYMDLPGIIALAGDVEISLIGETNLPGWVELSVTRDGGSIELLPAETVLSPSQFGPKLGERLK